MDSGFASTAFMFQQPRLLPWKTRSTTSRSASRRPAMKRAERHFRARALALRLGLAHRDLDKFPHQLSGGMQSRVALARALVLAPELLLLDEPFSALDVGLKEELYRLLLAQQAERGMGVLMITHDLMEAVRLSDAILVMAPEPGASCAASRSASLRRPATMPGSITIPPSCCRRRRCARASDCRLPWRPLRPTSRRRPRRQRVRRRVCAWLCRPSRC